MTNRDAHYWLAQAGRTIDQRGKERDQPDGERSIGRAVTAFNALTGNNLAVDDGALFMVLLKAARGKTADDLLDLIAYAALRAEAIAMEVGANSGADEAPGKFCVGDVVKCKNRQIWGGEMVLKSRVRDTGWVTNFIGGVGGLWLHDDDMELVRRGTGEAE